MKLCCFTAAALTLALAFLLETLPTAAQDAPKPIRAQGALAIARSATIVLAIVQNSFQSTGLGRRLRHRPNNSDEEKTVASQNSPFHGSCTDARFGAARATDSNPNRFPCGLVTRERPLTPHQYMPMAKKDARGKGGKIWGRGTRGEGRSPHPPTADDLILPPRPSSLAPRVNCVKFAAFCATLSLDERFLPPLGRLPPKFSRLASRFND